LRRRLLRAFLDGSVVSASASELAQMTDQRVGQVAYHLKTLAKLGILRAVQGGEGEEAEQGHRWALGVEADWLRLALELSAEADVS